MIKTILENRKLTLTNTKIRKLQPVTIDSVLVHYKIPTPNLFPSTSLICITHTNTHTPFCNYKLISSYEAFNANNMAPSLLPHQQDCVGASTSVEGIRLQTSFLFNRPSFSNELMGWKLTTPQNYICKG